MFHKIGKHTHRLWLPVWGSALLCGGLAFGYTPIGLSSYLPAPKEEAATGATADTIHKSRYTVAHTVPSSLEEIAHTLPADLKSPENVHTVVDYDWRTGQYLFRTRLGEKEIGAPIVLSPEAYSRYLARKEQGEFFLEKYRKGQEEERGKADFNLLDMEFSLGPAEKIFGQGGIHVRTQGSASLSMGMKHNVVDNPTLSEQSRDQWTFDFDEQVQLNMKATIGSKMSFDLNYNTESTFDFDASQFKLAFAGEEDDIIQNLEAGNVSMSTGNSLISGGASLFGVKTQFKFGKLGVTALLAKQEASTKTVSSKGGVTKRPFEISPTEYDENRHYFLGHYFRDTYDQNMAHLPLISSGIVITKIEVWMTNKKSSYDNARNILAFADLGESNPTEMQQPGWATTSGTSAPANSANSLYSTLRDGYADLRDITLVSSAMPTLTAPLSGSTLESGADYEKVESARLLSSSEYTLNTQLGYLSLKSKIDDDCVLAVAFQYTKGGQTYQVGEFSGDNSDDATKTLYVKLLKSTTGNPDNALWDLMMKNVYSLGVTNLQQSSFSLQVQYLSDSVGVYTNYINADPISQQLLIKVLNLDQLNANNERHSDGQFDWVDGFTVQPTTGRIIFPVVEPFGSHLATQLGSDALAEKYCYNNLYRQTLTDAEQDAEHNKFILKGEYTASSGAEISLGAMNVARGSVVVTAGGATLKESKDYSVDYAMGIVTILNQSIIESGTDVSVSLEDQSEYSLQRKTMMGLDLQYDWSKNLSFGATVINLSETPLTTKVSMNEIPISNTIYGFNFLWHKSFMWLTNAIGTLPWINDTNPSDINIGGEWAQLHASHSSDIGENGSVYIDDFESSESSTSLATPTLWHLASTPTSIEGRDVGGKLFTSAYNAQRAHFAWYRIDNLFTSQTSSLTPAHIKNDITQLCDPRVRQVTFEEIYPNKELEYGETGILDVLNLAYYPQERGQYNVSAERFDSDGNLRDPEDNWGGMMRALDVTNFETANYEYIEFWMMDPFIDVEGDATWQPNDEGKLVLQLGEVSEDILKDGYKSFENGLDINGDLSAMKETHWGRVSTRTSTVYAFDNSTSSHTMQDVGLDGLTTTEETTFSTYQNYVDTLRTFVSSSTLSAWEHDPFSPLNDPAGDNYRYFRGSTLDDEAVSILDRYKYINGTEGNAPSTSDSQESYSTAYTSTPDVEDLNTDNTLNENERFYEYDIELQRGHLTLSENKYLADVSTRQLRLRDGNLHEVKWYLFRIPLRSPDRKVGNISNFKSIRFLRMLMTGWKEAQVLRMATLDLVRSDWRTYTGDLSEVGYSQSASASLSSSTVNIEEHSGSLPVNYVLPPNISRIVTPGTNSVQQNEQALSLKITDLEPHDAKAVYKTSGLDLRQYTNLQLFAHLHANEGQENELQDGDLAIFLRVGADYRDNYYEYEVPLHKTAAGTYNNNSSTDREKVWPEDNMVDVKLSKFTSLKRERNTKKEQGLQGVTYTTEYSVYDSDNKSNRITVKGNPSLGECTVFMIGVRNVGRSTKSATVWVNELRTDGMDESGGWAANAHARLRIATLATFNASGSYKSAGWGTVEQSTADRSLTEDYQYAFSGQTDLGKWIPKQVKLSAPLYYSYSRSVSTPQYDPYNEDLTLEETLDTYSTTQQKDSVRALVQTTTETSSLSLTNVKFNVKSKKSKPWDPANFTVGYSQNKQTSHDPTTEYEYNNTYKATFNYQWSPFFKPWQPFAAKKNNDTAKKKTAKDDDAPAAADKPAAKKKTSTNPPFKKLKDDFQLGYLPSNFSLAAQINRTYHEEQLRNVETYESDITVPVSYTKTFTWLRQTSLDWAITKNLKFNFQSATNARIDEPDAPVNKNLFPDEYERWRDTIWTQIWKLGTPVDYNQTFDVSWNIPISKITWTDWMNLTAKYKATYEWNRGTDIDETTSTGNTVQNNSQWQFDASFNFETLYNKSKFLKKANDKYKTQRKGVNFSELRNNQKRERDANGNKKAKEYRQTIALTGADTLLSFTHGLNTRRVTVTVHHVDEQRPLQVKYNRMDANNISFHLADSGMVEVVVKADKPLNDMAWYKSLQVASRILMMVRSVRVGYKQTQDTYLPYFRSNVGDFYGQGSSEAGMVPGLGFAFGFEHGKSFTDKAQRNGWLIVNDSLTSPAVYNCTKDFSYSATLEPWAGFKIQLTGSWRHNEKESNQFMTADLPITRSGSFQMTTIAIGRGSFSTGDASDNYYSDVFHQFVANREVINQRLLARYAGATYPTSGGFINSMDNHDFAGKNVVTYNAETGQYVQNYGASRLNSADVLVPAFLSAYVGGNASSVSLNPIPSLWRALPNWKVTYNGLLQLVPKLSTWIKSIELSHAYNCTYSIGNYQTYTNFLETEEGLGYMLDVTNNCPIPSSEFDIGTVTLTESWAPLGGLNATLNNGLSLRTEWKHTRATSLSMSAAQITENVSRDLTVGVGYRIADFHKKLGMENSKEKGVNHDLNMRFDMTYKDQTSLLRKVADEYSQATSGNTAWTFKFQADYQFSKMLQMKLYYNRQVNTPLVSTSYPTVNSDFGMTLSLSLTR